MPAIHSVLETPFRKVLAARSQHAPECPASSSASHFMAADLPSVRGFTMACGLAGTVRLRQISVQTVRIAVFMMALS